MSLSYIVVKGTLVAEEPIHVGSGSQIGVTKDSLAFIPGSVLRGAFGAAYLRLVCSNPSFMDSHEKCPKYGECSYVRLFGDHNGKSSPVFFRYAYPLHLKCGGVYLPVPRTVYVCEKTQCGSVYEDLDPPVNCVNCGSRVKPFNGYRCSGCGNLSNSPITLTSFTSTAVDRVSGAAAQVDVGEDSVGTLHVTSAIPRGSRFYFEAILSPELDDLVDDFVRVLERMLPDDGLGGSRTRGFGKVSFNGLSVERVSVEDALERVVDVSSGFCLVCVSPLLVDGGFTASSMLEAARRAYSWVYHRGKPSLPSIELISSRVSKTVVGGWSEKTGRESYRVSGYSSGSVFCFKGKASEELSLALAALEVYPFGGYKPHGCGQFKVVPWEG
ncbi:MAG: RAMP superfamily CRISPR-associated protein [Candidatus Ranarchaeia archaeon]